MNLSKEPISRRALLVGGAIAFATKLGGSTRSASAETLTRQAAVRFREDTLTVKKDSSGNIISQEKSVDAGNDYVLSPTQERGRERIQRVLVRIGSDGIGRELNKVVAKDGSHTWKVGGDTFVFSGRKDTEAPIQDVCEPAQCGTVRPEEYRPGMKIDAFRVKRGGGLEYFLTFPTAFDCNPREQRVLDTITIEPKPQATPEPVAQPTPAPRPVPAPVQLPSQTPRSSNIPLNELYGSAAIASQNELGRVIYE